MLRLVVQAAGWAGAAVVITAGIVAVAWLAMFGLPG